MQGGKDDTYRPKPFLGGRPHGTVSRVQFAVLHRGYLLGDVQDDPEL